MSPAVEAVVPPSGSEQRRAAVDRTTRSASARIALLSRERATAGLVESPIVMHYGGAVSPVPQSTVAP
jgi:hypothetical protein